MKSCDCVFRLCEETHEKRVSMSAILLGKQSSTVAAKNYSHLQVRLAHICSRL